MRAAVQNLELYVNYIRGRKGLEIGGPSSLFQTILPAYQTIKSLDGVNFATHTIWEPTLLPGEGRFVYGYRQGTQYLGEATALPFEDHTYDIVLCSHCLEHSANPLQCIEETKRVLSPSGCAIYVLPWKEGTFDHNRSVTSWEHLLDDYKNHTLEGDLTHLPEILRLHDITRDPGAGTFEQFTKRSLDNASNRALHQHVFDEDLMRRSFEHFGFKVVCFDLVAPFHEIILVTL